MGLKTKWCCLIPLCPLCVTNIPPGFIFDLSIVYPKTDQCQERLKGPLMKRFLRHELGEDGYAG